MGQTNNPIILGVDPGSRFCGYALIEKSNRNNKFIKSGTIKLTRFTDFFQRLQHLSIFFAELVREYNVSEVAFESLIYVKNPKSLIKLSQVRGAIIGSVLSTGPLVISEYSPNLIKSTVCGHGHAEKEQILKIVKMLLNNSSFDSYDASDAAAIAICHSLLGGQGEIKKRKSGGSLAKAVEHALKKEQGL